MSEAMPWYESTTIKGAIVSSLVFLINLFHISIAGDEVTQIVTAVFGLIGIVMTIYGRFKATKVIE